MNAAVLLPGRFPDLHDLATWMRSDTVYLDDTRPWSRKSRVHRGRIRTKTGLDWVYVDQDPFRVMGFAYRNSPYFEHYEPELATRFHGPILDWLAFLARLFEIEVPFLLVSDAGFPDPSGFHDIWHEPGSRHYQPIRPWMREVPFTHPVYPQTFGGFVPGACCFDLLFACGPESVAVLDRLRS
jgi:hypothetical protein